MAGREAVERHDTYFRVPEELMERVEEIVYEKSGPDTDVTKADVVREAARDYIKKFEENLRVCDPAERGEPAGSTRYGAVFVESEHRYLKEIAYEESEPGSAVSVSDVLRAALRDYVEKYDDGIREVEPAERGGLESPFE
jgi:metal-responsive CopG/Arc/MetJ family transcriptional regulator